MIALIDGDTWIDANGYERNRKGYIHRQLAEKVLGRKLTPKEQVHHVDGNRSNNNPTNLVICPNNKYHKLLHARTRIVQEGGNPNTHKYCDFHKTLHERSEFSTQPSSYDGIHNRCRLATNEYRKEKGLNRNKFDWKERLNQQYRRVFSGYTKRSITKL